MPAFTPRGYPYPIGTVPADIPQSLEDLARAIDTDVEAVSQTISPRPAFRLQGSSRVLLPLIIPSPSSFDSAVLGFDRIDAVTGGALEGNALEPVPGFPGSVVPALPGFWWIQVIANFPRANGTNINDFGLSIEDDNETFARANTHLQPPASDGANNLVATMGAFFNGTTNFVRVRFTINKTATTPGLYTPGPRYMFAVRMTES